MSDTSNVALLQRVTGLTREEAIEAVLALGEELDLDQNAASSASNATVKEYLDALERGPNKAIEEVDAFARVALVTAGSDPDHRAQVQEVLDGVGEASFIFGGAELILAGYLGVRIVELVSAKGRQSEEEVTEVTIDEQGQAHYRHRRTIVYPTPPQVGEVLRAILEGRNGG